MRVLVANAGSSSVKLRLSAAGGELIGSRDLPPFGPGQEGALEQFALENRTVEAVGHRIVHGGAEYRQSIVVEDGDLERLSAVAELAPLHNRPALRLLTALKRLYPDVPHVACFDTAFHSTLSEAAALYALPRAWVERWGLRRYGFHGLSHAYASRRAAEILGRSPSELRVVSCHLGAGASLAAVANGRSVDTTMGFTPNEGLVMATRSGSVDPGLLIWLQQARAVPVDELDAALERSSGLLGLSGVSGDVRQLLSAAAGGDSRAETALAVYVHRLVASIAGMAAAMAGLDVLVFTGGVGEGSSEVRLAACERLAFLGVEMDSARNREVSGSDADLTADGALTRTLVIHSREDAEISTEVRRLLG